MYSLRARVLQDDSEEAFRYYQAASNEATGSCSLVFLVTLILLLPMLLPGGAV